MRRAFFTLQMEPLEWNQARMGPFGTAMVSGDHWVHITAFLLATTLFQLA